MLTILIALLFATALLASGTIIIAMWMERFDDIMLALIGEHEFQQGPTPAIMSRGAPA